MTDLWDACRYANQYLAIVGTLMVFYRLSSMLKDRERRRDSRALHLIGWFSYVALGLLLTTFASYHYSNGTTPANWTSGGRTVLLFVAIGLSIWWPHPRKLTHVGEGL